jgi:hypothetical protein
MFNETVDAAVQEAAVRYHADPRSLLLAVIHEAPDELANVLGVEHAVAEAHMERISRILTVQSDWGAGCKLLTDQVQAELAAAIKAL